MISLGMVEVDVLAEANECDLERGGDVSGDSMVAGTFFDAAVEGFISCAGDGCRLRETD